MLVATRDPLPHPGAHDGSSARPHAVPGTPRVARFMTVLQVTGSLLAIPVGLACAYSMYRANFSPDTRCQSLRANIVAMIDKQIDAGTRRMLVRRDVEAFEKTCGGVDPDAEAAFRALLAADKAQPARAATPAPAKEAKEAARKPELRPSVTAKPAPTAEHPARDTAVSDAKWLAAVRGALVSHDPERTATAAAPRPASPPPPAAPVPAPESPAPANAPAALAAPAPVVAAPAQPQSAAPALPPATAVATVPAQPAEVDHPVPPAAIPDAAPAEHGAGDERFGWVKHIPFVGQALTR